MTINEPDREEGQRPMTAQEFYDTSLDLLSEGNGDGSDEILRPGTAQRPPTGFLRAGTGLMRTATPGAIPPSPLNRTLGTPRSAANRPSTAELPLLRPYTAEKSLNQSQSLGFSAPSSNPQPSLASSASLGRVAPPKSNFRPSTTGCGRPVSTPSASRYEVGGGLGGLSVVARPQSNVPLSKGKGKQTMYQDTEAKFLDSGMVCCTVVSAIEYLQVLCQ